MKNRYLTPLRLSRRSDRESSRSSVGEAGFFNPRALLGLTLCFAGLALAIFAARESTVHRVSQPARYMPVPGNDLQGEAARLAELEQYWQNRLTYPTGRFDPAWVRAAAAQHARMASGIPVGTHQKLSRANPLALTATSFTALRQSTAALSPIPVRLAAVYGKQRIAAVARLRGRQSLMTRLFPP
ncbi:MAG: hypothetical protein DMF00_17050 [Verrucomicrobia bacterium]|nr:MAG: hypothetical protein DMF00_17050 [Verrucomicrobiota bacterium]